MVGAASSDNAFPLGKADALVSVSILNATIMANTYDTITLAMTP
jgi:hypothetical protein